MIRIAALRFGELLRELPSLALSPETDFARLALGLDVVRLAGIVLERDRPIPDAFDFVDLIGRVDRTATRPRP